MLKLTALMDDIPGSQSQLISEHGLSYYVQYNGLRFLFDCGQSDGFLHNARQLGISLSGLDGVILSHSHYDHARGYLSLTENRCGSRLLYTGSGFWEPKYALKAGNIADLSCGFDKDYLRTHGISHREIQESCEIAPGVWLISNFLRVHTFETIPERFLLKKEDGYVCDDFRDEICMALEVTGGLAVLAGCSHPGILNMLTHIQHTLHKPIRAVFGGTHLVEADEGRIQATISALQKLGVEILGLGHCTGNAACSALANTPELRTCRLHPGDQMQFD